MEFSRLMKDDLALGQCMDRRTSRYLDLALVNVEELPEVVRFTWEVEIFRIDKIMRCNNMCDRNLDVALSK